MVGGGINGGQQGGAVGGGGGGRSWEIILLPLMLTLFKSRYNNKL